MEIRTILVELGDDPCCADRIRVAGDLARRHDAHVVGLTATGFRLEPFRSAGEEALHYAEGAQKALRRQAQVALDAFTRTLQETAPGVPFSHRLVEEETGWALATAGRVADIVLTRQPSWPRSAPFMAAEPSEYALLNSGRPLVIVPEGVRTFAATHPMIAWDGRREAARAVTDAMPFLQRAAQVTVLGIARAQHEEEGAPVAALLEWLQRHGVAASATMDKDSPDAGPALLAAATRLGADLIVAGGYGHSRVREFVMGGATRSLMHDARLLVLLSH